MARLSQGILGGISGKIGNIVGSSWKGIAIVKTKPLSVANPRTAGQITQRTKMSNIVAFSKAILPSIIKPLWDRFAQQASGYNEFVSENIHLFSSEYPTVPADLVISKGKMAKVPSFTIAGIAATDTVSVDWDDAAPDSLSLLSDKMYAVVTCPAKGLIGVSSGSATRGQLAVAVNMPGDLLAGDVLHGYLAARRDDGTVVSVTAYATDTI